MIIDNEEKKDIIVNQDDIELKLDLIKFVGGLLQQNVAMQWEINKEYPKAITSEDLISEASKLYNFITGK